MNKDEIVEELKNYRSYKHAVAQYNRADEYNPDRYMTASPCRVTLYSDMPMGTGSGSRQPLLTGGWTFEDVLEYNWFTYITEQIESAMETLSEDERRVIQLKWMDGVALVNISKRIYFSERKVSYLHTSALNKLHICMKFIQPMKVKKSTETQDMREFCVLPVVS